MTTLLILAGAMALIGMQPALMRAFPQLRQQAKDPWVEFWQEAPARWAHVDRCGWDCTSTSSDIFDHKLRPAPSTRLLENATQLLNRIRAESDPPPPPSEVWIDGTTGKRVVPAHLNKYDRSQQLRDMEMQIRQHDQAMELQWAALNASQTPWNLSSGEPGGFIEFLQGTE